MADRPSRRFIDNLRLLLAEKKSKQVKVAKALKKSQAWVSQLLNEERDTPTHNVDEIARVLNVPVERLWLPHAGLGSAPAHVATDDLTPDERILLERCRALNGDGIKRLIDEAEVMAESARYTNVRQVKRGT